MKYDTYVTFASWEDRFYKTFIKDCDENEFENITILNYSDGHNLTNKDGNIEQINQLKPKSKISYNHLKINKDIDNWKKLKEVFQNLKVESQKVLLNISTMPRNIIYYCLKFLDDNNINYDAIYYSAQKHDPKLTQSPLVPYLILQQSGVFASKKPTLLVVSLGYDEKRIYQVYNHFEPKKLIILKEEEHQTTIDKDINFKFNDITEKETYTINSFQKNTLLNILEKTVTPLQNDYNIVLCSLGPKISAIDFYNYNKKHPDIGLCYVSLKDYSVNYSKGVELNNPILYSKQNLAPNR
jgi:hypothetical protein